MILDLTYQKAIEKAEHLIALDETDVYLQNAEGFPFDKVSKVEVGSTYRMGLPTSYRFSVDEAGLCLHTSVDIEPWYATGSATTQIDRGRMRDLVSKLSPTGRRMFADALKREALPAILRRTDEIRASLNQQSDSEDCIRGMIAFAEREAEKEPNDG